MASSSKDDPAQDTMGSILNEETSSKDYANLGGGSKGGAQTDDGSTGWLKKVKQAKKEKKEAKLREAKKAKADVPQIGALRGMAALTGGMIGGTVMSAQPSTKAEEKKETKKVVKKVVRRKESGVIVGRGSDEEAEVDYGRKYSQTLSQVSVDEGEFDPPPTGTIYGLFYNVCHHRGIIICMYVSNIMVYASNLKVRSISK